jgi:uncharacterized protein with HEPN domain
MPSKNPAQRLRDILDNIEAIESFTVGLDLATFAGDRKSVYAVVRALEIISEASRRLPETMKEGYEEIDWTAIAAAGNIYRHEYEVIDEGLIWHTARRGLTMLHAMALAELRKLRVDV